MSDWEANDFGEFAQWAPMESRDSALDWVRVKIVTV